VPVEQQLHNIAVLPFIHRHVTAMPDVPLGKNAVSARVGELGIIPGSMGARSYIMHGRGSADSFHSCSQGAGRLMSRGEARQNFTLKYHREAMAGVECRKNADAIDETPVAYKNIDTVMVALEDLVTILPTLKQVVCVKG
jgi:tRNA-splicing ligase RtcB